jgi:hypothetical protein
MFFDKLWAQAVLSDAGFVRRTLRDHNPLAKTTKYRVIYQPNEAMMTVHERLITYVRSLRTGHISEVVAPFSRSPFANVHAHRRSRFFYLLDFHHAYQQVRAERLVEVLCQFDPALRGHEHMVLQFLQRFCFAAEGGLATGANASPDLFNLYVGKLVDEPLSELLLLRARTSNDVVRYTRYIDDLTFSTSATPWGASIRWRIKQIIKGAGFPLNRHKVLPPLDLRVAPILITGLRLVWGRRILTPRHYLRLFRAHLRTAIRESRFEGDFRIEKLAGAHGVVRSGLDHEHPRTALEQEILDLWETYCKSRKQYLREKKQQ